MKKRIVKQRWVAICLVLAMVMPMVLSNLAVQAEEESASNTINLKVGETITIDNTTYQAPEILDDDVASWNWGTAYERVSGYVSGGYYLLVCKPYDYYVTQNEVSSFSDAQNSRPNTKAFRLAALNNTVDTAALWKVTGTVGSACTVQAQDGRYLVIDSASGSNPSSIYLSDVETNLVLQEPETNIYRIKASDYDWHLNNWWAERQYAAGWSGNGDQSKWRFFAPTQIVITGDMAGETTMTIGDATYTIKVYPEEFMGMSFRMKDTYDTADIRFGYRLYLDELNAAGYDQVTWQWKWGLNAETLDADGHVVAGKNYLQATDGEGGYTSNLVITNVPCTAYDTPIYSKLIMTCENTETGDTVVYESDVQMRTVKQVATAASNDEEDGPYANALLAHTCDKCTN